jgi:HAD superfamily phosphatase (TIGR01668 family)
MLKNFLPAMYVESVYDIPYRRLLAKNISAFIFDLDNTLAPFNAPDPPPELARLLAGLAGLGGRACLLSNNGPRRVARFAAPLGLPYVCRAGKPGIRGAGQALALLGAVPSQAALVGDQLFPDIWCGRRAGLFSILVRPVAFREEFPVRLKRPPEKLLLAYFTRTQQLCLEKDLAHDL